MITLTEYFEIDSRKKNEQWADKLISHFRNNWENLIDEHKAQNGMRYLLSNNDMKRVTEMFKDPKETGMNFVPIAIMEKLRNILIAERNKAGIHIGLHAIDTSAKIEKDADYTLLKNRAEIEGIMSSLQKK